MLTVLFGCSSEPVAVSSTAETVPQLPAVEESEPAPTIATQRSFNDRSAELAEAYNLEHEFRVGHEMLKELSELSPEEFAEYDIAAFRGQRVAFLAGVASPGGTNDLVTELGFYIRVVNLQNEDFRPHSVWWSVLVIGEVQQVLPNNKLIVLKVKKGDWLVLDTG